MASSTSCPSACLLVRRSSFGDGFDETLRYGEDVDFVWRLHDHGWLVRYVADVVVTHRARSTWRGWWAPTRPLRTVLERTRQTTRHATRALSRRHVDAARVDQRAGRQADGRTSHHRRRPRPTARANARHDRQRRQGRGRTRRTRHGARRTVDGAGGRCARSASPSCCARCIRSFVVARCCCSSVGTAYRWRSARLRVADIPLGVADDVAYGTGVMSGAVRSRSLGALKPHITKSTLGLRNVLGLKPGAGNL